MSTEARCGVCKRPTDSTLRKGRFDPVLCPSCAIKALPFGADSDAGEPVSLRDVEVSPASDRQDLDWELTSDRPLAVAAAAAAVVPKPPPAPRAPPPPPKAPLPAPKIAATLPVPGRPVGPAGAPKPPVRPSPPKKAQPVAAAALRSQDVTPEAPPKPRPAPPKPPARGDAGAPPRKADGRVDLEAVLSTGRRSTLPFQPLTTDGFEEAAKAEASVAPKPPRVDAPSPPLDADPLAGRSASIDDAPSFDSAITTEAPRVVLDQAEPSADGSVTFDAAITTEAERVVLAIAQTMNVPDDELPTAKPSRVVEKPKVQFLGAAADEEGREANPRDGEARSSSAEIAPPAEPVFELAPTKVTRSSRPPGPAKARVSTAPAVSLPPQPPPKRTGVVVGLLAVAVAGVVVWRVAASEPAVVAAPPTPPSSTAVAAAAAAPPSAAPEAAAATQVAPPPAPSAAPARPVSPATVVAHEAPRAVEPHHAEPPPAPAAVAPAPPVSAPAAVPAPASPAPPEPVEPKVARHDPPPPAAPTGPRPKAAPGTPFDDGAARTALASGVAASHACRQPDDPTGVARITVTFASSGRVTSARVSGPPFQGTPTGSCIATAFRGVHVPPFEGDPVSVTSTVTIR